MQYAQILFKQGERLSILLSSCVKSAHGAGHLDRPPIVFPTVTAQVEGHFDLVTGSG